MYAPSPGSTDSHTSAPQWEKLGDDHCSERLKIALPAPSPPCRYPQEVEQTSTMSRPPPDSAPGPTVHRYRHPFHPGGGVDEQCVF